MGSIAFWPLILVLSVLPACTVTHPSSRADVRPVEDTTVDSDATNVSDTPPTDTDIAEPVDPLDPIWDAPVEWSVRPSEPRSTDGGRCGVEPDGRYLGPCELQLAEDWVSTLCDEERKTCVAPFADCRGGWCYVPPRSFLAGGSRDVTWWGAMRIAVMPRGFYIMQTEVTLDTFERLLGYLPDIGVSCGPECPAAGVTPFEAMELANRLSDLHGLERCHILEGCRFVDLPWPTPVRPDTRSWACDSASFVGPQCNGYRLPSEREGELAIRAGSPFCLGRGPLEIRADCEPRDPKSFAQQHVVFCGNSRSTTDACPVHCSESGPVPGPCWPPQNLAPHETLCLSPQEVRSKRPNDFGLYGAYGNVLEWTLSESDDGPLETPTTIETASEFVDEIRWHPDDEHPRRLARVSGVYHMPLDGQCGSHTGPEGIMSVAPMRSQSTGFRLVRTANYPALSDQ